MFKYKPCSCRARPWWIAPIYPVFLQSKKDNMPLKPLPHRMQLEKISFLWPVMLWLAVHNFSQKFKIPRSCCSSLQEIRNPVSTTQEDRQCKHYKLRSRICLAKLNASVHVAQGHRRYWQRTRAFLNRCAIWQFAVEECRDDVSVWFPRQKVNRIKCENHLTWC